jgi:hypothetical protein
MHLGTFWMSAGNPLKHKKAFTTAPILMHWMLNVPLIVETDASDYAIAGILSIVCPDSEIHPVVFYSRTLTPPELNYDTHDKELLAIHKAFWTWRHYLEGSSEPIDVVTDHKNLEYFATTKLLSCCQARWSEFLHQFNMIIHFHPGVRNHNSVGMKRPYLHELSFDHLHYGVA